MFKGAKAAFSSAPTTLIAKGTLIVGDIHFHGNLEIEGEVEGNIVVEGSGDTRVRVLDEGLVKGEIQAPFVVVRGRVAGSIKAIGYVQLHATAVIEGHIRYNVLEMEKGAQVNGSMVRDPGPGIEQRKPNPTLSPPVETSGNWLDEPPYRKHTASSTNLD